MSLFTASGSPSLGDFTYTYQLVVSEGSGGVGQLSFYPSLNNSGQVAYSFRNSGISGNVARWQNGVSTTIGAGGYVSPTVIDDSGSVVFQDNTTVYLADGITQRTLFTNVPSLTNPNISSRGEVIATVNAGPSNSRYLETRTQRPGQSPRTVFRTGSGGAYITYNSGGAPSPDINAAGDVVVRGLRSNPTASDGIYRHSGTTITTIADNSGSFASFGNIVDINDLGEVAFDAVEDGTPSSDRNFYIHRGGINELVADGDDFDSLFGSLQINNTGGMLFTGVFNGSKSIFNGGDPMRNRVLGAGDLLQGAVITDLLVRRGMLNDAGDFVFRVSLDDNFDSIADRSAIFLATANAIAVPEPLTAIPVAIAIAGAMGRRRRRIPQGG